MSLTFAVQFDIKTRNAAQAVAGQCLIPGNDVEALAHFGSVYLPYLCRVKRVNGAPGLRPVGFVRGHHQPTEVE